MPLEAAVKLKNTNPLGAVDLPLIGRTLEAGEVFDVPDAVAGRAPSTSQDEDGNDVLDPGEGLLAQVGNYEPATKTEAKKAAATAEKASTS